MIATRYLQGSPLEQLNVKVQCLEEAAESPLIGPETDCRYEVEEQTILSLRQMVEQRYLQGSENDQEDTGIQSEEAVHCYTVEAESNKDEAGSESAVDAIAAPVDYQTDQNYTVLQQNEMNYQLLEAD